MLEAILHWFKIQTNTKGNNILDRIKRITLTWILIQMDKREFIFKKIMNLSSMKVIIDGIAELHSQRRSKNWGQTLDHTNASQGNMVQNNKNEKATSFQHGNHRFAHIDPKPVATLPGQHSLAYSKLPAASVASHLWQHSPISHHSNPSPLQLKQPKSLILVVVLVLLGTNFGAFGVVVHVLVLPVVRRGLVVHVQKKGEREAALRERGMSCYHDKEREVGNVAKK